MIIGADFLAGLAALLGGYAEGSAHGHRYGVAVRRASDGKRQWLERLRAWGVTRIYGYPGDGINGVLGAF